MRTTSLGRGRRLVAVAAAGTAAAATVAATLALSGPAVPMASATSPAAGSGGAAAAALAVLDAGGSTSGSGPAGPLNAPASGPSGSSPGVPGGDAGTGPLRCTEAGVGVAQHLLETDLANRAAVLSRFATRISSAKHLPAADASALQGIVTAEQTSIDGGGIEGLQRQVPGETTCSQLAATAKQMVVDFRVYALVARQVNITACSTGSLFGATAATNAEPRIEARIQQAAAHGKNVSGAQQAFTDLQGRLASATQALSGIDVNQVLAQQPSNYPGDASMLQGDIATMKQADTNLKVARTDLRTIRQNLRQARTGTGSSGGGGNHGTGHGTGRGTVSA